MEIAVTTAATGRLLSTEKKRKNCWTDHQHLSALRIRVYITISLVTSGVELSGLEIFERDFILRSR